MENKITLSPSRVGRWVRCKKAYYWRYHRKLVRFRKSTPLIFGSLVAEALAGYYRKPNEERNEEVLRSLLNSAIKRETLKSPIDKETMEEYTKAIKIATRVLEPYHDWAKSKDDFKVLHVEATQEIELTPSVHLLAIPDAVVAVDQDINMILEHKVRSRYRVGDFGIDYQSVASCLVSGSIGTLYNVLEYGKLRYHRDPIIRSDGELNYFKNMFIHIGEDILSSPPERLYPMPFKRCSCEYWELCNGEMTGLDLDDIINELYQKSTRPKKEKEDVETEGGE